MSSNDRLDWDSPGLAIALMVRFALEIALLLGVAAIAWHTAPGWWQWPATIGAPVLVAILWGLLLSPKAPAGLPEPAKLVIEAALFVGAGACLFLIGYPIHAGVGVILWIVDRIAIAVLDE